MPTRTGTRHPPGCERRRVKPERPASRYTDNASTRGRTQHDAHWGVATWRWPDRESRHRVRIEWQPRRLMRFRRRVHLDSKASGSRRLPTTRRSLQAGRLLHPVALRASPMRHAGACCRLSRSCWREWRRTARSRIRPRMPISPTCCAPWRTWCSRLPPGSDTASLVLWRGREPRRPPSCPALFGMTRGRGPALVAAMGSAMSPRR